MTIDQYKAANARTTALEAAAPVNNWWKTPEQFGAIGNGVVNDTAALQTAIDWCTTNGHVLVNTPRKKYRTTDTLQIGSGSSFSALRWVGCAPGSDAAQGVSYISAEAKDRPAINIQGARGVLLDGLTIRGGAVAQINALHANRDKSVYTVGFSDTRWTPHVGIAIDALSGPVPPGGGYPGKAYGQWSSSGITIRNCTVQGFVVGWCNFGTAGNADNIILDTCYLNYCAVPYAICQTQARANHIRDCFSDAFHTGLDCRSYGVGNGSAPAVTGGLWVRGYRAFNVTTSFDPFRCDKLYVETMVSIGSIGGPLSTYFCGCNFVLLPIGGEQSNVHGTIGCPAVNFTACAFSTPRALLNLIGTSGVIGAEVTFEGCTFVSPQEPAIDYAVCKRSGGQRVNVRGGPVGSTGVVLGAPASVAASGYQWAGDTLTFTASGLLVGKRLLWRLLGGASPDVPAVVNDPIAQVVALRVTAVDGTNVTAVPIILGSELDKTWQPASLLVV